MSNTPRYAYELPKDKLEQFAAFLKARGSQVLAVTNEYEVMRFTGADGSPCVIYQKGNSQLTWQPCALEAYTAFAKNKKWRAGEKTKRSAGAAKRMNRLKTLAERDGSGCFFCGSVQPLEEMTIEHFVPVSSGGPNHISNMAIACCGCNREAGHLSVTEKLKLAMAKRGKA
ncbi:HNH endonuclease [Acetobacter malorum]|uniref:HNH endonuclease n=1 Tax=Acetobacter malorum TaxID=178901 RepID=A0A177G6R9_9PROT|nr:HNH endonuclease [Acetobacter malorum]OAG75952.1 HNH endonuclease [Acetobacter malorum]